jgi:opacity protein-like surface antigen
MKAKLHHLLAASLACTATALIPAGNARADGVARAPAAYTAPSTWTGVYIGAESGWETEDVHTRFTEIRAHSNTDRDVINAGLFAGYQQQFGSIVLGVEVNLIGNEFDFHKNLAFQPGQVGTCPAAGFNCTARITDIITVGPRIGWSMGHWMPYITGGWATGNVNFRSQGASGVAVEWSDNSQDGWFLGGGFDWKIAPYAVVGFEYRHVDLGEGPIVAAFDPRIGAPNVVEHLQHNATADAIMLRGSLLFGRQDYAPLK